jgi:hypothetical protein
MRPFDAHEQRFGVHGGDMETSLMLAIAPHKVRMDEAQVFASSSEQRADNFELLGNGQSAKLGWHMQDYNPHGAAGNAAAATADKGQALLDAVGKACPKLPLYWYSIPSMSGVAIRADLILRAVSAAQAGGRCANVRGVKFSEPNLHIYANCVALEGGKFDCPYGSDEQALGALAMGARGFIGSTYNYVGRPAADMIAAYRAGDMPAALAAQRKVQAVVDLLFASGDYGPPGCAVGKAIMELRLGGAGCGPARAHVLGHRRGAREVARRPRAHRLLFVVSRRARRRGRAGPAQLRMQGLID